MDAFRALQVLFPALRALDFQGLCPFVPLPDFWLPPGEPFFRFGSQIISAYSDYNLAGF